MNGDLRKEIAKSVYDSNEGHIPSAYSIIDILNYLYENILKYDPKNPKDENRDYFILSKGHGCNALYVVLKKYGFITQKDIDDKCKTCGILGTHPDRTKVPGIEASTGSLGTGIGMAVGIALGLKIKKKDNMVYCLIGDGESNEGTVWESALVASKYNLNNLVLIMDCNGSADIILPVKNPELKWKSFGFSILNIDGHNIKNIEQAFKILKMTKYLKKPSIIIMHTKKGKGVSFMEKDFGKWHSKVPNKEELETIYRELDNE
jgi:transketolase